VVCATVIKAFKHVNDGDESNRIERCQNNRVYLKYELQRLDKESTESNALWVARYPNAQIAHEALGKVLKQALFDSLDDDEQVAIRATEEVSTEEKQNRKRIMNKAKVSFVFYLYFYFLSWFFFSFRLFFFPLVFFFPFSFGIYFLL
jgi:hypothetical protein